MATGRRSRPNHAGLLARGLAWFVDGIVLVAFGVVIVVVAFVLFVPISLILPSGQVSVAAESTDGTASITALLLPWVYYIGSEARWGQTPGKMVLQIRVVYTDGRPVTGSGAVVRNVTKILGGATLVPVLVAIALILLTDDNQRLGDIVGDTMVVTC